MPECDHEKELATRTKRNAKMKRAKGTSSKFIGVTKKRNKWHATIRRKHLGTYDNEIEAAIAYNKASYEMFGEDGPKNIIDD